MTGRRVIARVCVVLGFAVMFAAGVMLAAGDALSGFVLVVLLGVFLVLAGTRIRRQGRQRAADAGRRAEVLAWWHDEQRRGRGGRGP